MTESITITALSLLCTDLGYRRENLSPELELFLRAKLATAEERLAGAGLSISEDFADLDLLVSYAAWLYRGRVQQQPMSAQLRWQLRNRQAHTLLKEAAT